MSQKSAIDKQPIIAKAAIHEGYQHVLSTL